MPPKQKEAIIEIVDISSDEEDDNDETTRFNIEYSKEKLKKLKEFDASKEIPKGMIPKEIEEQIEELPTSGLLSKPEEEEPTDSLLGRV